MMLFFVVTLSLCLAATATKSHSTYYYPPYGDAHWPNHTDTYGEEDYDSEYQNYTSRIRYFKAIDVNVNVTFDLQLSIPLGDLGTLDLELPISIVIQNKSIIKIPYPYPPLKVPLFYPVIKLPKLPSFLSMGDSSGAPSYPNTNNIHPYFEDQAVYDYFSNPRHQLAKRSLAAHSALHRFEIYSAIENSLDKYGQNGRSCLLKAICELAQKELLIESVLHEVIEHLLSVSRSVDEDGLLGEYVRAEEHGAKPGSDCHSQFQCPFSVFQKL